MDPEHWLGGKAVRRALPVREELRGKAMRALFSPPSLSNITFCLTLNSKPSVLKTIKKNFHI
jgi:hypothetical protein